MPQLCIKRREGKRGITFQASFETAPIGGKRTRKTVGTFKTKREAQEVGTRVLNEYLTGNDLKKNNMSFADFVNNCWFENYVKVNTLETTQEKYRKAIKNGLFLKLGVSH